MASALSSPSPDGDLAEATGADARIVAARQPLFDGIRGIAILLVILSHGWALWPTEKILDNRALEPLFTSGNYAVSIFFVVGAFLATRSLLRQADSPRDLRPGVAFLRRYVRLSGQLYVLLIVVVLVTVLDDKSAYPENDTGTSVWRIATYTWNWYLQNNAIGARPDLGHLWYLSVELQVFAVVLVLVYLLSRQRGWLLVTLGALLVGALFWRHHLFLTEGDYHALLQTTGRMDAPLVGSLAAVAATMVRRGPWTRPLLALSVVALVPVIYLTDNDRAYFGWPGVLLDLVLGAFVLSAALAPPPRLVRHTLGFAPLALIGRRSFSLYLWHYPVFWFVSRHTIDWSWQTRTLAALLVTLVVAEASERLVEVRVQRAMASARWRELDDGIPHYVSSRFRAWWESDDDAPQKPAPQKPKA